MWGNEFFKEFTCSFIESVLLNKIVIIDDSDGSIFQQKEDSSVWLQFLLLQVKVLHSYVITYLFTTRKEVKFCFHLPVFRFGLFFFQHKLAGRIYFPKGLLCNFVFQLGMNVSHSTLLMLG